MRWKGPRYRGRAEAGWNTAVPESGAATIIDRRSSVPCGGQADHGLMAAFRAEAGRPPAQSLAVSPRPRSGGRSHPAAPGWNSSQHGVNPPASQEAWIGDSLPVARRSPGAGPVSGASHVARPSRPRADQTHSAARPWHVWAARFGKLTNIGDRLARDDRACSDTSSDRNAGHHRHVGF